MCHVHLAGVQELTVLMGSSQALMRSACSYLSGQSGKPMLCVGNEVFIAFISRATICEQSVSKPPRRSGPRRRIYFEPGQVSAAIGEVQVLGQQQGSSSSLIALSQ
jgi:hypothetical protein